MSASKKRMICLAVLTLVAISLFLGYGLGSTWKFALELRLVKLSAMLIVACCVAYSSIVFQTMTANRILTPSIMGFEAVYMMVQTVIVFIYGDKTFRVLNSLDNFLLSVLSMIGFSLILYFLIFKKGRNNLYLLLLVGLVLGILFNTLSSFMQLLIDPNDFFIIQGKMFASFNKINNSLLGYSSLLLIAVFLIGWRRNKSLDVLALGRDQAINLGLHYTKSIRFFMIIIAILVSVSTALVGPMAFLGLLVSNLTYQLIPSHRHALIIPACCLVSGIAIIGGQFLMERVFHFSTPVSTIINLVGGLYFLYLLLKVKKI